MLPLDSANYTHLITDLDGRTTEGRDQNLVTGLDGGGDDVTLHVGGTRSNSKDVGLVKLLNVLLGNVDSGGGLGSSLDSLDENSVEQGSERLDVLDGGGHLWLWWVGKMWGEKHIYSCGRGNFWIFRVRVGRLVGLGGQPRCTNLGTVWQPRHPIMECGSQVYEERCEALCFLAIFSVLPQSLPFHFPLLCTKLWLF